jgi:hypothetical protein
MPNFSFAQHVTHADTLAGVAAAREAVADLSATGILHPAPIDEGTPWPELVSGFSGGPDLDWLDLLDLDVLHPEPIIDGFPAPDLILDVGLFG